MEITININDYLSEEDKIKIAQDAFKEAIRYGVIEELKSDSNRQMDNYERVIGNSVHHYLQDEIDAILGTDTKALIRERVKETVGKLDYNYSLFRTKSFFETEDSPAQTVVKETIRELTPQMKEALSKKMMENIEGLEVEQMLDVIREMFYEIIQDKLKK